MSTGNTVKQDSFVPCYAIGAHEHNLRIWKRTTLTRCAITHEHYIIQERAEMVHDPRKKFVEFSPWLVTQENQKVNRNLHKLGYVLLSSKAITR